MSFKKSKTFSALCIVCLTFSVLRAREATPLEFITPLNNTSISKGSEFKVQIRNINMKAVEGFFYLINTSTLNEAHTFTKDASGRPFDFGKDSIFTLIMPDTIRTGEFLLKIVLLASESEQPPENHRIRLQITPSTANRFVRKDSIILLKSKSGHKLVPGFVGQKRDKTSNGMDIMGRTPIFLQGSSIYVVPNATR